MKGDGIGKIKVSQFKNKTNLKILQISLTKLYFRTHQIYRSEDRKLQKFIK